MDTVFMSIDGILSSQVGENRTPSVQYILFDQTDIIHRFCYGFADIRNSTGPGEQTTYNWYSVTKTFTAIAILQLEEENRLNIDHPVKEYLPEFAYPAEITARQLLSHTAGIPNPVPLGWIHLAEEHTDFNRNNYFGQVIAKHGKTRSKPNEKFMYSNLGYVLLGQLIEKVSGMSYEEYIRENIIKRLDLTPADLGFVIQADNNHATGYHRKFTPSDLILGVFIDKSKFMGEPEGKWRPFKRIYVNGAPYGGLIGNSGSLVRYIRELLKPGGRLLSEESKRSLFTENLTNAGKPTGMCFSWFKGNLAGNTYYTHAGGGGGFYCEIRIYPGLGLGSVIVFNRTGMRDERFLDKVDGKYILKGRK